MTKIEATIYIAQTIARVRNQDIITICSIVEAVADVGEKLIPLTAKEQEQVLVELFRRYNFEEPEELAAACI